MIYPYQANFVLYYLFNVSIDCFINLRLETDVKKLKADLQSSRNTEQELRIQVNGLMASEKASRSELFQLQQDNENLQNKYVAVIFSLMYFQTNLKYTRSTTTKEPYIIP